MALTGCSTMLASRSDSENFRVAGDLIDSDMSVKSW